MCLLVRMNQFGYEGVLLVISDVIVFNLSQSATLENNHKAVAPFKAAPSIHHHSLNH